MRNLGMTNRYLWGCLFVVTGAVSCNTTKKAQAGAPRNFTYSYCTPTISTEGTVQADAPADSLPADRLSGHDRLLCRVLGISGLVRQLEGKDSSGYLQKSLLRLRIAGRIEIARTELASVAAELDCEGERANLAAGYLDNLNNGRNRRLTVASVVTGAFTSMATTIISGKGGQIATSVSGGLLSAGLALATINPKGRQIAFFHERNLLRPIWEDAPVNTDYPLFVWNMLHEKQFSNSGTITLAQSIRNRWLQFEFNGKPDKKDTTLLFGNGGLYHAEVLHIRAAMLNQLQSTIRSMNQDLASLVVALEKM